MSLLTCSQSLFSRSVERKKWAARRLICLIMHILIQRSSTNPLLAGSATPFSPSLPTRLPPLANSPLQSRRPNENLVVLKRGFVDFFSFSDCGWRLCLFICSVFLTLHNAPKQDSHCGWNWRSVLHSPPQNYVPRRFTDDFGTSALS